MLPINPGQAGSGYNSSDAWDYFHINSVDKDADGNYLISARDACAVHKVNGTDGSIIWRVNGKKSDFKMADGTKFCFQHHARFVKQYDDIEIISLYDNSAHGTENGRGTEVHTAPTSSGKVLKLNTTSWECELVHAYFPPDDLRSKSQGSTQLLPNGNVLVNWGSEGAVTEFTEDGKPLFHAYMDSDFLANGVENYRAFRYNWTGLPNEEPAIVALDSAEGTRIYVSWNGDTETKAWRFYASTDGFGSKAFLGEVEKAGFETSLLVPGGKKVTYVSAEAVDARGKVIRVSGATSVEPDVLGDGITNKNNAIGADASGLEKVLSTKPTSNWDDYAILKIIRLPMPSDL